MVDIVWIFVVYTSAALATLHVLLHKRDPRAALLWIVVCLGIPGLGVILYLLFGRNRIRTRALTWQDRGQGMHPDNKTQDNHEQPVALQKPYASKNYQLLRQLSDRVTRRPLLGGNSIAVLHNGEQAYPAMLAAIATAKTSIALSTYIFDTKATGRTFVAALCAAAERGVQVRVLVDGLGELYSWPQMHCLFVGSKVKVARFLPFTLKSRGIHFNLRNHRKLLIIDGSIGFTGGMNISQRHCQHKPSTAVAARWGRKSVVDIHFKVQGPVVGQMQETFREDWNFATGETFSGRSYPQPLDNGNCMCRGVSAGPNEKYEKLVWISVGTLNCARKRVAIMTPYFIPDRVLVSALIAAQLRGVKVEIILPQHNNLSYVQWASRGALSELLEYGVKCYYQPPPFVHSKLLLMDDHYAQIGSANMDSRSRRLNFEFVLELYDIEVNRQLREHFGAVSKGSQLITLAAMEQRPLVVKLRDNFFRLFSPFL